MGWFGTAFDNLTSLQTYKDTWDAAGEAVSSIGSGISKAAGAVKGAVGSAADWVGEKAQAVADDPVGSAVTAAKGVGGYLYFTTFHPIEAGKEMLQGASNAVTGIVGLGADIVKLGVYDGFIQGTVGNSIRAVVNLGREEGDKLKYHTVNSMSEALAVSGWMHEHTSDWIAGQIDPEDPNANYRRVLRYGTQGIGEIFTFAVGSAVTGGAYGAAYASVRAGGAVALNTVRTGVTALREGAVIAARGTTELAVEGAGAGARVTVAGVTTEATAAATQAAATQAAAKATAQTSAAAAEAAGASVAQTAGVTPGSAAYDIGRTAGVATRKTWNFVKPFNGKVGTAFDVGGAGLGLGLGVYFDQVAGEAQKEAQEQLERSYEDDLINNGVYRSSFKGAAAEGAPAQGDDAGKNTVAREFGLVANAVKFPGPDVRIIVNPAPTDVTASNDAQFQLSAGQKV